MHNKSENQHKIVFLFFIVIFFIGLLAWSLLRGSDFFSKQIQANPSDLNLNRLWNNQDYDEILSLGEKTLEYDSMNSNILIFSGFASYQKALEQIDPDETRFYLQQGVIYLRKALLIPNIQDKPLINYMLGKCYLSLGRDYADLAIKYLNKSLDLGYKNKDTYEYLAQAYSYFKDYEKSIEYYELSLENYESDHIYLQIAADCFNNGMYNKAAKYYDILIEKTNDESLKKKGLFHLGKLYYDIKNFQKAKTTLQKLVDLDPNDVEGQFLLGEVYLKLEDNSRAREQWQKTRRLNPGHIGARKRLYN